jgi:CheY-like chemotaxis protein
MHAGQGISLPEDLNAIVIDDDEIACEHTKAVLQELGIKVDTFTDPAEALDEIRDVYGRGDHYDLMMTDYKMPVMNGLDLTRAVREFDGGKTAIILLTGYNWDIIEDEAREDGVEGMLAKPLFQDNLKKKIFDVLTERHGFEAPDVTAETEDKEDESIPEGFLAGRRVLMAEDVEQNAEILEDLLSLEDIESEHAVNGQMAVDMFTGSEPGHYDAILMDVRMPVMDGLTATSMIRALDRPDAKTIPIIAMTANVFDEDVRRSIEAGMDVHLSKPVEPEKLYMTIAKLLTERNA